MAMPLIAAINGSRNIQIIGLVHIFLHQLKNVLNSQCLISLWRCIVCWVRLGQWEISAVSGIGGLNFFDKHSSPLQK